MATIRTVMDAVEAVLVGGASVNELPLMDFETHADGLTREQFRHVVIAVNAAYWRGVFAKEKKT